MSTHGYGSFEEAFEDHDRRTDAIRDFFNPPAPVEMCADDAGRDVQREHLTNLATAQRIHDQLDELPGCQDCGAIFVELVPDKDGHVELCVECRTARDEAQFCIED